MITRSILLALAAVSLMAAPAMSQTADKAPSGGHHYTGGPATATPRLVRSRSPRLTVASFCDVFPSKTVLSV
jgi:hypothetical protein